MKLGMLFASGITLLSWATAHAATIQYFPPTETGVAAVGTLFERYLRTMGERALPGRQDIRYAVRVTVLVGQQEVLALRIEQTASGVTGFTFTKHPFLRSGDLSRVASRVQVRRISPEDFSLLVDEVQRQNFFSIGPPDFGVTGGSLWLLEVLNDKGYHAAYLPARPVNTPFGAIVRTAARVAGVPEFGPLLEGIKNPAR